MDRKMSSINIEHQLYKLIQQNDTQQAMKILDELPHLNVDYIGDVDVDVTNKDCTTWSMIQWASFHGNEKILESLLQHGYKERNDKYFSPLHIAAQNNHISICWLLILSKISYPLSSEKMGKVIDLLDHVDKCGNIPLHTAAANGYFELVNFFLDIGSNPSKKNKYNNTALDVTTNESCRNLLRKSSNTRNDNNDDDEEQLISVENRAKMVLSMIQKYHELESKLIGIYTSTMVENINSFKDLYQIQDLISSAIIFGIRRDVIDATSNRLKWLRMRRELVFLMDDIYDNAPIITSTKYEHVYELQQTIHFAKNQAASENSKELPGDIEIIIKQGMALCKQSNAEFHLNKAYQECRGIPLADKDIHAELMEILKITIENARNSNSDLSLVQRAEKVNSRLLSELSLIEARERIPNPKLPLLDMTPKQAKNYWKEEDIGHIKETDGFPLPPSDDSGYVWIQSTSLQSLHESLIDLESCINEGERVGANEELIESSKTLLKKKRDHDLKVLLEKNEVDYAAALASTEKAAKKIISKKKGTKSAVNKK